MRGNQSASKQLQEFNVIDHCIRIQDFRDQQRASDQISESSAITYGHSRARTRSASAGVSSDPDSDAPARPGQLGTRPNARDRERRGAGRAAPRLCSARWPLSCGCPPQPQGYSTTGACLSSAWPVRSGNPPAFWGLSRQQKRLDQLTLATHGHAREALVPFSLGHIRLGVEPCRGQLKLRRRNLPALNAFEQMLKQRGRKILSAYFRHAQMP